MAPACPRRPGPRSISIAAVTIFIVDPGARLPRIAALKPSLRLFATARMCPLLGWTAITEASGNFVTACSAAACTFASRYVLRVLGSPSTRVSRVRLGASLATGSIHTSAPGLPPALLP